MTAVTTRATPARTRRIAPDSELLERLDERLPRYTSYPTAPHFTPRIDADRIETTSMDGDIWSTVW